MHIVLALVLASLSSLAGHFLGRYIVKRQRQKKVDELLKHYFGTSSPKG